MIALRDVGQGRAAGPEHAQIFSQNPAGIGEMLQQPLMKNQVEGVAAEGQVKGVAAHQIDRLAPLLRQLLNDLQGGG